MSWNDGIDRATGYIVTATDYNNMLGASGSVMQLKSHAHGGTTGEGTQSLGPLVLGTFTDAAAPAAPGAGKTTLYSKTGGFMGERSGAAGAARSFAETTVDGLDLAAHASRHNVGGADAIATGSIDKGNWSDTASSIASNSDITKTVTVATGRNLCRSGVQNPSNAAVLGVAFGGSVTTDAYALGTITGAVDANSANLQLRAYATDLIGTIGMSRNGFGLNANNFPVTLRDFYINGTSLTWVFHNVDVLNTLSARTEWHAW